MSSTVEIIENGSVVEELPGILTEVQQFVTVPPSVVEVINTGPQGPPGGSGSIGDDLVSGEVPTGAIDGVNKTFTTTFPFSSLVGVYLNGIRQSAGYFTIINTTTFQLDDPPIVGDDLEVDYIKA